MRLVICGGRDYGPIRSHVAHLEFVLMTRGFVEVGTGAANGADLLGELVAIIYNLPVILFRADWKKYGKSAGPIRNAQMAEWGDVLFAFPGGRGTTDMINQMIKHGKKVIYAGSKD